MVAVLTRRRSAAADESDATAAAAAPHPELITGSAQLTLGRAVLVGIVWSALAGLLIAPGWALVGAVAGACVIVTRRSRLPELTALATLVAVGAAVTWLERADAPLPNGLWPARFERLHEWAVFAVVSLLCGALTATDATIETGAVANDGTSPGADDGTDDGTDTVRAGQFAG